MYALGFAPFLMVIMGTLPVLCMTTALGGVRDKQWPHFKGIEGYKLPAPGDLQVEVDGTEEMQAVKESLAESRATVEELEDQVERLTGLIYDIAPDRPPRIFFNVENEGVKVNSWVTNETITLKHTAGYNGGIAYDSIKHNLYYSSYDGIYRGNRDDTATEMVFNSAPYGVIQGLAHDWITGNLYGVTRNGIVFVCNTSSSEELDCDVLASGLGDLYAIALNPLDGVMYWTTSFGGTIMRAEMDGSNVAVLVSGLNQTLGIAIDFDSSRLYWTDHDAHKIQSSDLQGQDLRLVTPVAGAYPWGVATMQDRVYWTMVSSNTCRLQSITKAGEDVRTLYEGVNPVHHLVLATANLPRDRPNHCDYYSCSRICVLTATYARCVN